MGMTMTQKILAAHAGLDSVSAGQLIEADLDLVLGNDITSPVAIHEIDKMKVEGVFNKDKIALVMDHFAPNKDIKSAEHCKCVREFACKNEITNYFDVGKMGIEHALLPEQGLTVAGDVIIGADSHTCTYGALGAFSTGVGSTDMAAGMATGKAWFKVPSAIRFNIVGKPAEWISGKDVILHIIGMIGVDGALYKSMEFVGEGLKYLSMDDRFTIANMAIEAGGKNGIFPVDDLTREYMKEHSKRPFTEYEADSDAEYDEEYTIDLSTLKSTVSFPHLPDNTRTIDEVGDVKIDQVVIGSCTNGRMDDLRIAAKGKSVKADEYTIKPVMNAQGLVEMQGEVEQVFIHDSIYSYIVDLVDATRTSPYIELGVSPRGTIACVRMAKAYAYLSGRSYVIPSDVVSVFADVTKHRIVLNTKARVSHVSELSVIDEILKAVKQPTTYVKKAGNRD